MRKIVHPYAVAMLALAWAGVSTASRQVVENRQVPFDLPGVSGVFGCH